VYANGDVDEGAMDHGRRQGPWVYKSVGERKWLLFKCTDDVERDCKVRPTGLWRSLWRSGWREGRGRAAQLPRGALTRTRGARAEL
jgi:hypothetical protein